MLASTTLTIPSAMEVVGLMIGVVLTVFAAYKLGVWSFIKSAAKVPLIIEAIAKEFNPNGGDSMRDRIHDTHLQVSDLKKDLTRIDKEGTKALKILSAEVKEIDRRVLVLELGRSDHPPYIEDTTSA